MLSGTCYSYCLSQLSHTNKEGIYFYEKKLLLDQQWLEMWMTAGNILQ